MPEQWIIRVEGKEYGPADLTTLQEWKAEGRVLPANDARRAEDSSWEKADRIPGLFELKSPPVRLTTTPRLQTSVTARSLFPETFAIYTRGFFKYLGLTMLVVGPSVAAQLTGTFINSNTGPKPDAGTLIAGAFIMCMVILNVVLTPVYIAGIQILTAAYAAGERIGLFATLNEAVKFWPRVALLWVLVFLCFAFWIAIPSAAILSLLLGQISVMSIFLILLTGTVMVWVVGRLFINFMFWQQFAVLEGCTALESLRRSRELARSRRDLPWYRRPMWRGIFIISLWSVVLIVLNWPTFAQFTHAVLANTGDAHKIVEAFSTAAQHANPSLAAYVLQEILKPLLGIAFVLLFLDSNVAAGDE
jgi:hypothetical protein